MNNCYHGSGESSGGEDEVYKLVEVLPKPGKDVAGQSQKEVASLEVLWEGEGRGGGGGEEGTGKGGREKVREGRKRKVKEGGRGGRRGREKVRWEGRKEGREGRERGGGGE